ncbi:MAG: hypothetical protein MSA91_02415 [Lachnobacterium sp.]|nr:hypothetical protein [Lachnobacterium sp.]
MDLLIVILLIVIPLVISSKKKAGTNQQKGTGPQMQKVLNQMQTTVRQQVHEVWSEQQNGSRQQNMRPTQQAWAGQQQARPQQQSWAGQQQARPQQQAWAGQQNARPQGMWVQQELDLQQMDPQERMRRKKAELQEKYKTIHTGQTTAVNLQKNNSIVDRAKLNNAKLAEDETLKEIEVLHGHKETHASEKVQHDAACQALKHDDNAVLAEESLLGSIDDLMAKGYSGDLSFDRDFIGEAMDMIASFTVPDTVPDMVPDAMAKYQNA